MKHEEDCLAFSHRSEKNSSYWKLVDQVLKHSLLYPETTPMFSRQIFKGRAFQSGGDKFDSAFYITLVYTKVP